MGYEDGFKKALLQLALFAPKMDLNKCDVLNDVKDGELVRKSQMESSKEPFDSEMTSKVGDAKATLNSILTSNPPTTQFI